MKRVTLSFDNGPEPVATNRVLDILAARGIKTTFFVIGERLRRGPAAVAAVERAVEAGHWIGNHTDTHETPLGLLTDPDDARAEIIRCQFSLGTAAHADKLFRPCGGGGQLGPHLLNRQAADILVRAGYTCVLWNSIPRDWDDPAGWVETAQADCARLDWPLIVLHDIDGACVDRLDEFLEWLQDNEFEIRQDFPDDCLPLRKGQPADGLDALVAA